MRREASPKGYRFAYAKAYRSAYPLGLIPVTVSHHFEKGYSTGVIKKYIAAKIRASQEIQDKKPIIQNSKFKIKSSKILTHHPVFKHLANFTMAIN